MINPETKVLQHTLTLPGRSYERVRGKRIAWFVWMFFLLFAVSGSQAQEKRAGASLSADSLLAKEVMAKEFALQKAEIEVNVATMDQLTLPDYIEVNQTIMNRDQVLAMLRRVSELGCHIQPIRMKDAKVTFLSPDIATVIYHATQYGTCGSRGFTAAASVSTVWVRRGGQWLAEMHIEHARLS